LGVIVRLPLGRLGQGRDEWRVRVAQRNEVDRLARADQRLHVRFNPDGQGDVAVDYFDRALARADLGLE
jgi:hypothetical protein